MLKIIGADISPEAYIPYIEVTDNNGNEIGTAYGERNARLLQEAETMFNLLKRLVPNEPEIQSLIDRVENSPEIKEDGMTMKELHKMIVGD